VSVIRLRVLGPVQVEQDGKPVHGFESQKALALLCYLALHSHPIPRSHLAALFWGDRPEARGRSNLRRALNNLTSLLPDSLQADRHMVQFRRTPEHQLDVDQFHALMDQGDPGSLAAAVALYRGELLAGLSPANCPDFEAWLAIERERWHQRITWALDQLVTHHMQQGEYRTALDFASRLVALDPWREEAHRQKMLLLARTGQYNAALAQFESCRRILAEELNVEPSPETIALYKRIRTARTTRRHNLPPQPTPFVGRERELQEIRHLLANPECRLLTLTGPGGIGKTRLALRAAAQNSDHFLHGICFVPLAPVPTATLLASAILDALSPPVHSQEEPKTQLLRYLRDREMLLLLDGFEHLREGADLLVEILENAPEVKLLVTSRERLHLRWEWIFEVEGLRIPENGESPLQDLRACGAVQLFLQIALRTHPRFSLEREKTSVISICRSVEGMPLGIELAAAWVRKFPCATIAREIKRNLDFLTTPLQDMPERHHSLRATFDYSWRMLSKEERRTLRKLSVFRGGFRQEAAGFVADASPALLAALEEKSLLRKGVDGRYEMHDLLRQYAEEKLQQVPQERSETQDRHCAYYAAFLHQREASLGNAEREEALEEISEEIENIRAGWTWAITQGKIAEIDRMLESLYLFYEMRSRFREGEEMIRRTVDSLKEAHHLDSDRKTLGRLLIRQGILTYYLGRYRRAQELLEEGLAIARKVGSRREMALALNNLGVVAGLQGDYEEEKRLFRRSLSLYRALGDQRRMAVLLNNLGIAERTLGAYEEARQLSQESLAICRAIGYRRGIARALQNLALVAHCQEAYDEAKRFYQESLDIFRENGDQWGVALTLGNLGDMAYHQGEYEEAQRLLQESLALRREIGEQLGVAIVLNTMGSVARAMGNRQAAGRYFQEALEISAQIPSLFMVMDVLVESAWLLAEEGEAERAIENLAFALQHPATETRTREKAQDLLNRLSARLSPEAATAAQERGRNSKLEDVIARKVYRPASIS